jgi:hypothetical protein
MNTKNFKTDKFVSKTEKTDKFVIHNRNSTVYNHKLAAHIDRSHIDN